MKAQRDLYVSHVARTVTVASTPLADGRAAVGIAVRAPGDSFCRKRGRLIAEGRARCVCEGYAGDHSRVASVAGVKEFIALLRGVECDYSRGDVLVTGSPAAVVEAVQDASRGITDRLRYAALVATVGDFLR